MDVPSRGVDLLPGAAVDFAVTFEVPENCTLKDLVYQPSFYGGDPACNKKKFRVSLQ